MEESDNIVEIISTLLGAINENNHQKISILLAKNQVPIPVLNQYLNDAIKLGNYDIVKTMLEYGADVNYIKPSVGFYNYPSALDTATLCNNIRIVKLLLNYGADIHSRNDSAFALACTNGYLELVKLYVELGVQVLNQPALTINDIAINGHDEILKLFINYGYEIPKDILCYSSNFPKTNIVKFLLDNGAEVENLPADADIAHLHYTNWPMKAAVQYGTIDSVQLLIEYGANPNRFILLVYAAIRGHFEIFQIIYQSAEWTLENQRDIFQKALDNYNYKIVIYLMKRTPEIFDFSTMNYFLDKILVKCSGFAVEILIKILHEQDILQNYRELLNEKFTDKDDDDIVKQYLKENSLID